MKTLYHPEFSGAAVVLLESEEVAALARLDQALTDAGIRPFCEAPIGSERSWDVLFGWLTTLAIAIETTAQDGNAPGPERLRLRKPIV